MPCLPREPRGQDAAGDPLVEETEQSELANWLRFFAARDEEAFEMTAKTSPTMVEAWGVVKRLSAD